MSDTCAFRKLLMQPQCTSPATFGSGDPLDWIFPSAQQPRPGSSLVERLYSGKMGRSNRKIALLLIFGEYIIFA